MNSQTGPPCSADRNQDHREPSPEKVDEHPNEIFLQIYASKKGFHREKNWSENVSGVTSQAQAMLSVNNK